MGLNSIATVFDEYGPVAPSLAVAPIHFPEVRNTDGLGLEEATTNLMINPRVAVDPTNWVFGAAASRVTNRGRTGTTSVKYDFTGGGGVQGPGYGLVNLTAGITYTISHYAYLERALGGVLYLDVVGVAGVNYDSPNVPLDQTTLGRWQRVVLSIVPPTTGTYAIRTTAEPGPTASGSVWVTDVQVEAKGYATSYADGALGTGYAWTGAAHGSTSTRAAARLRHPLTARGPLTVAAFVKVGVVRADAYVVTLEGTGAQPALSITNGTTAFFTSLVDVAAPVGISYAAGDVVFLAGILNAAGTGYSIYAAKNGAPPGAPGASTASAAAANVSTVEVGAFGGGLQVDSGIEQLLVYNAALTAAEVAALATGPSADYADDPRIVYAAATPSVRGTTSALTAAGTGRYRRLTDIPANLDRLADLNPNVYAFGTGATHRLSVPAGTGYGIGQVLGFGNPADGPKYRVVKVHAPGGQYDELYATQITP